MGRVQTTTFPKHLVPSPGGDDESSSYEESLSSCDSSDSSASSDSSGDVSMTSAFGVDFYKEQKELKKKQVSTASSIFQNLCVCVIVDNAEEESKLNALVQQLGGYPCLKREDCTLLADFVVADKRTNFLDTLWAENEQEQSSGSIQDFVHTDMIHEAIRCFCETPANDVHKVADKVAWQSFSFYHNSEFYSNQIPTINARPLLSTPEKKAPLHHIPITQILHHRSIFQPRRSRSVEV